MSKPFTTQQRPGQYCCEKCRVMNTTAKSFQRKDFGEGDMQWPDHMQEIHLCDKHAIGYEPFIGSITYISKQKQLAINYKYN